MKSMLLDSIEKKYGSFFEDYNVNNILWAKNKKDYLVNGETKTLGNQEYMPDLMHNQLVNFIKQNKNQPFYVHYSMSHVHNLIQETPDSKPDSKDFYADNVAYMDKLVGKLILTLEELKLRENTLIVFMGDNGTANEQYQRGGSH